MQLPVMIQKEVGCPIDSNRSGEWQNKESDPIRWTKNTTSSMIGIER